MFLRLGWVVGQNGIWLAIATLVLSYVVTTSTALSLCAIVTNGEVKGGGIYFLVGRSMGPKWGSMLGLLFFWAQVIAAAMYSVGVAEVLVDLFSDYGKNYFTGEEINDVRVVSVGVLTLLLAISFLGMGCFAKTQTGLFVTMMLAIVAAVIGSFFPDVPSLEDNRVMGFVGYTEWINDLPVWSFDPTRPSMEYNFFTVFAVFFPAATGIMAGANVSGDLAKPSSAIPKGTLSAIAISFAVYFALIFILGLSCVRCIDEGGGRCPGNGTSEYMSQDEAYFAQSNGSIPLGGLLYNKIIMANLVPVQPFFFFGVFASSLSSALSSLVSAPRIVQAMAKDPVFPSLRALAKGSGPNNEPVRGLVFSYLLAICFALIGNLDAIATLITNIFLASYALVNLACFVASSTKAAGWHPTFSYYNRYVSVLGALLCVAVMFLIDWTMALATLVLCGLVYVFVGTLKFDANWGAADDALAYNTAMMGMESVQLIKEDNVKLYRVAPLVMCGAPGERPSLLKFAVMLSKTRGLTLVGDVLLRTEEAPRDRHLATAAALSHETQLIANRRAYYDAFLNNTKLWGRGARCPNAFPVVTVEDTLFDGFAHMLHTAGIGKLRPNSVVFGFPSDLSAVREYEQMLRVAFNSDMSGVMVVRDDQQALNVNFLPKPCCHKSISSRKVEVKLPFALEDEESDDRRHERRVSQNNEEGNMDQFAIKDRQQQDNDDFVSSPAEEEEHEEKQSVDGLTATQDLPFQVNGAFIDVWWLADDGGFSILVPHVLRLHNMFRGKKLRVFVVVFDTSAADADKPEQPVSEEDVPAPVPTYDAVSFCCVASPQSY